MRRTIGALLGVAMTIGTLAGTASPSAAGTTPCTRMPDQGIVADKTAKPGQAPFKVMLTELCVGLQGGAPKGSISVTARARVKGAGINLPVAGVVTLTPNAKTKKLEVTSGDVKGTGTFTGSNMTIKGSLRLHGKRSNAGIDVSGSIVMPGLTGNATAGLHYVSGVTRFDAKGSATYVKDKMRVSGTFDTYLGFTTLPKSASGIDPKSLIGGLHVTGTGSVGTISGKADVMISRPKIGSPFVANLELTDVALGKGITIPKLTLGNTAKTPGTVAVHVTVRVPALMKKDGQLEANGSISTANGVLDLTLDAKAGQRIDLIGGLLNIVDATVGAGVTLHADDKLISIGGYADADLSALLGIVKVKGGVKISGSIVRSTGDTKVEFTPQIDGAAGFLAFGSAAVSIKGTGNLAAGRMHFDGSGTVTGGAAFGFAAASGSAALNADFTWKDRLHMAGTASYQMKLDTVFGMTHDVDDGMSLRFDDDHITIVSGYWRHKLEKVDQIRGELWPVARQCGRRATKPKIDWFLQGWQDAGWVGSCDANGNVPIGTITGRLLTDDDKSGTPTAADKGLAHKAVLVRDAAGKLVGRAYTDATGAYSIRANPGTNLSLTIETMPAFYRAGYGMGQKVSVGAGKSVQAAAMAVTR